MWTKAEYHRLIDTLGVIASYHYTKPPAAIVSNIKVGFAAVSKENEVLINSLGAAAKIITVKADDVAIKPLKFDTITVANERYTVDSVNPVHLPGTATVVGYRLYCKGLP